MKGPKRQGIIAAVAEARAHGDLKENAEYHAAREEHGFNEGRIAELEAALSNSEIIDTERLTVGTRIVFGAIVDLIDVDTDTPVTYQIVGDVEADIKKGLIAVSSPIARALIGKSEGDEFDFTAPNGVKTYSIEKVRYS
jgi:transcription elongation factor GreA